MSGGFAGRVRGRLGGGAAGAARAAGARVRRRRRRGVAQAGRDAQRRRRPRGRRSRTGAAASASSSGMILPPWTRLAQVVARVGVGDRAGEEGVGRVLGVVLVGGEEGREPRLGQRHRPGLAEVVGAAGLGVLAQDQPGPVERAREHPGRLGARPLGRLDLDRPPLLPDHRAGEGRDQGDDDHRGEQGGALLTARAPDGLLPPRFAPLPPRGRGRFLRNRFWCRSWR